MKREQTMKRRLIRPGLIIGILLGCTAQLAGQGQGQGGGQGQVAPVITTAVADFDDDPETLSLVGANFGSSPQVFIGNDMGMLDELAGNFATLTDTFIEAELGPITPGTYLSVVSTGPNQIPKGRYGPNDRCGGTRGTGRPPGDTQSKHHHRGLAHIQHCHWGQCAHQQHRLFQHSEWV